MYFSFMDMESSLPVLPEGKGARVMKPLSEGLVLENVTFQYPGSDRPALENISFRLEAGQTTALVGSNGSGKTTIVKLLTRLYDPTEGRITLDGVDLRDYDPDDLRRAFGVVLQDYMRYHLTVRENIGFGQIGEMANDNRIVAAAEKGQAKALIDGMEDGLDTVLGREFPEGIELSGGEWQRVAISRGFMREADILILDEPTAALDARTEQALYAKFAEMVRGRTAVFISHRLSTVRVADQIVVIEGGRLVENGSHDVLMAADGRYAHLFNLQAERYRD